MNVSLGERLREVAQNWGLLDFAEGPIALTIAMFVLPCFFICLAWLCHELFSAGQAKPYSTQERKNSALRDHPLVRDSLPTKGVRDSLANE